MFKCLAIIPARKNSIGLKNKNKLNFDGKPLFFWPILAALKSGIFDKIVLSTDDEEIIKKSSFFKEKIIRIKRPKKLSNKNSPSIDYNGIFMFYTGCYFCLYGDFTIFIELFCVNGY